MTARIETGTAMIDTGTLAGMLEDSGIAVIEVDEDTTAYEGGHIPGAVSLDWRTELHDLPRRDFIDAAQLAELLGSKGISDDQTLILMGGTTTGSPPTPTGCAS